MMVIRLGDPVTLRLESVRLWEPMIQGEAIMMVIRLGEPVTLRPESVRTMGTFEIWGSHHDEHKIQTGGGGGGTDKRP